MIRLKRLKFASTILKKKKIKNKEKNFYLGRDIILKMSLIKLRKKAKVLLKINILSKASNRKLFKIFYKRIKNKKLVDRTKKDITIQKKRKYFLKNYFSILKKRINIENYLTVTTKKHCEVKLRDFFKTPVISQSFKRFYTNFYTHLLTDRINFFNIQFKEIYTSLSLGLYLVRSKFIIQIFSILIGHGRYRFFKKNLYYLFGLVEHFQRYYYASKGCVRINISGKFKGKANRTQLRYLRTVGVWNIRTLDSSIIDYAVGFVATRTGIFGIKVWLNY